MGKKPELKKEKANKQDGPAVCLNKTAKFSVLDAAGITQTIPEDAAAAAASSSASPSKGGGSASSGGLQGRRANASSGPRMDDDETVLIGGNSFLERTKMPGWIKEREEAYAEIAARRAEELAAKTPTAISVTMPDGKVLTENKKSGVAFEAWKTSPYDVAASISQGLADSSVVARVTYADYVSDYDSAEDGVGGGDVLMGEGGDDDEGDDAEDAKAIKPVLWDLTRPLGKFVWHFSIYKASHTSSNRNQCAQTMST